MIKTDILIVGGGPAGSACAWRLQQAGANCLVIDQQPFPRVKACAGWITPSVVRDLQMDPAEYPYSFTTFNSFRISIRGFKLKLPANDHAIRRYEFDDWLLRRSGAPFQVHTVRNITRTSGGYDVDGEFSARYLVGAGGTYCPVYRSLFRSSNPKTRESLIAAMEEEFPYPFDDPQGRLWFFEHHLPGYAWFVPKANGYVNVGVGGWAEKLSARHDQLKNHWEYLLKEVERLGLIRGHDYKPIAHTYYLRQPPAELRREDAFVIGDAAGLATLDMGEGIGPAIKSGLLAAEAILHGGDYSTASIPRYSQSFPARLFIH